MRQSRMVQLPMTMGLLEICHPCPNSRRGRKGRCCQWPSSRYPLGPVWRNASDELGEIFLVDVLSLQLPVEPDEKIGILISNGHFDENTERAIEGWHTVQKRDHDWTFRYMHLDSIVNWTLGNGLVSELRKALIDLGIAIND